MKTFTIDRKPVMIFGNPRNVPTKKVIQSVYRKIPDQKNVPVMFMTRRQYLELYLKNQERQNGSSFSKGEKQQYIQQEMPVYRNIIGRYTTTRNPYFPPAVVFFNDKKIPVKQFQHTVLHEYGHEHAEKHGVKCHNEEHYADSFVNKYARRKK